MPSERRTQITPTKSREWGSCTNKIRQGETTGAWRNPAPFRLSKLPDKSGTLIHTDKQCDNSVVTLPEMSEG